MQIAYKTARNTNMFDYEQNNCRLCAKTFCCECCRKEHEKSEHNTVPDCNICFHGKIRISEISEDLLPHLKTRHWPLHCVFCKKVFNFEEEIREHVKCPIPENIYIEKSSAVCSILMPDESGNFESPPLVQKNQQNVISNLATSTPMQPFKENHNLLQKIKTVIITPVNSAENTKESILKKAPHTDSPLKRRVTFCETILTESMQTPDENYNHKSCNMETPGTGNTNEIYCSAKSEVSNLPRNYSKSLSNTPKLPPTKKVSVFKLQNDKNDDCEVEEYPESTVNNTLWISATNISTTEEKPHAEQANTELKMEVVTPLAANPKKKQINVVIPTPIVKEAFNSKIRRPVQISSTPNNSMIPVRSIPTAKEIFLKSMDQPSTSKSNLEFSDDIHEENRIEVKDDNSDKTKDIKNSDIVFQNKLWLSVNRFVKNVTSALQHFSTTDTKPERTPKSINTSSKRSLTDYDSEDEPKLKRFKLTEIKCRRTIRELPPYHLMSKESQEIQINIVNNVTNNVVNNIITFSSATHKTFVDKATQTEDCPFPSCLDDQ